MSIRSEVLQLQQSRKNHVKDLVECIEQLSQVIREKDARIVELQNFIGQIWQIAKVQQQSNSLSAIEESLQSQRPDSYSISFKEEVRGRFASQTEQSDAGTLSAPQNQSVVDSINSFKVLQKDKYAHMNDSSLSGKQALITTRTKE